MFQSQHPLFKSSVEVWRTTPSVWPFMPKTSHFLSLKYFYCVPKKKICISHPCPGLHTNLPAGRSWETHGGPVLSTDTCCSPWAVLPAPWQRAAPLDPAFRRLICSQQTATVPRTMDPQLSARIRPTPPLSFLLSWKAYCVTNVSCENTQPQPSGAYSVCIYRSVSGVISITVGPIYIQVPLTCKWWTTGFILTCFRKMVGELNVELISEHDQTRWP